MFELELHKGWTEEVLPKLGGVDVVVTSPPYNFDKKYNTYKLFE